MDTQDNSEHAQNYLESHKNALDIIATQKVLIGLPAGEISQALLIVRSKNSNKGVNIYVGTEEDSDWFDVLALLEATLLLHKTNIADDISEARFLE